MLSPMLRPMQDAENAWERLGRTRVFGRARGAGFVAAALLGALWTTSGEAHADTLLIRRPGAHPNYRFEAEPHLLLGFVDPPGPAHGDGIGLGFRGTIELVDNGFISSINNSIGIGFGLDWIHYPRGGLKCVRLERGGCVAIDDQEGVDYVMLPVVMQWNFWLSREWSVFGEPGIAFHFYNHHADYVNEDNGLKVDPFVFYAGGRWHFSDYAALTMRLGYPTFSVGVSFLF